ncbi:MAG: cell division topological specificity factor MinE [Clostridia bacterium]|nr:cell division topological specificity factor MinE [Clostridia bacterium]
MLENLKNFFKKMGKKEVEELLPSSSDSAKERLHTVLMQDRVNVSIDFLDLMKQDIIDVTKKYIDIDENEMDVRFTNQVNEDGTNGAPILYANIPIVSIKSGIQENKKSKTAETIKSEEKVAKKSVTTEKIKSTESKKKTTQVKKATKKDTSEK